MSDLSLLPNAEQERLVRQVKTLSWLSLGWMTLEGVVGVTAGIAANSIALIGYGVDSTIAGLGSLVIVWRFTGDRLGTETSERTAQKVVAVTFFLLAPYIAIEAVRRLLTGSEAEPSWVGIGLALVSIVLMPYFGHAKKRIGNRLQSSATTGEGIQNLLCAYLSFAILLGLAANAVFGIWWADPLVAVIVATAAVSSGIRTWRGETCAPTAC